MLNLTYQPRATRKKKVAQERVMWRASRQERGRTCRAEKHKRTQKTNQLHKDRES